jgi:hypothetical protein
MTSPPRIPKLRHGRRPDFLGSIVLAGKTAGGASIVARGVESACSRFARRAPAVAPGRVRDLRRF